MWPTEISLLVLEEAVCGGQGGLSAWLCPWQVSLDIERIALPQMGWVWLNSQCWDSFSGMTWSTHTLQVQLWLLDWPQIWGHLISGLMEFEAWVNLVSNYTPALRVSLLSGEKKQSSQLLIWWGGNLGFYPQILHWSWSCSLCSTAAS